MVGSAHVRNGIDFPDVEHFFGRRETHIVARRSKHLCFIYMYYTYIIPIPKHVKYI